MKKQITLLTTAFIMAFFFMTCSTQNSLFTKNQEIAKSFISTLNSEDYDSFISLFSENASYAEICSGRIFTGKNAILQYIKRTIDGMPDTKFEITSITADKKHAVVEWTWKATNSVGWPEMNIPATNKKMVLLGVSVMQIENGKIVKNHDYWDWNTFMREIGLE